MDTIDLERVVGTAVVIKMTHDIRREDVLPLIANGAKRILFQGDGALTLPAAQALADSGALLVGGEGLYIGTEDAQEVVHRTLLSQNVALLENIDLSGVPEGGYFLCAAPLKLGGLEGAPCRALLITF